jgi:SAM-dependent methyltransferase
MTGVFDAYARYYDLLYRDKDYAGEASFIASRIRDHAPQAKRILELGCGTGAHAEHLARAGYSVHGLDMSDAMIERAVRRKTALPPEVADRLSFDCGDARAARTGATYDSVISLFHVMSYQTGNADLAAAFGTAAAHLPPGGLFLFDFWYGPAVLALRPETRIRRLEDGETKVLRLAESSVDENANRVDVTYTVIVDDLRTGTRQEIVEVHRMRYLFLPEIDLLLNAAGLERIESGEWMTDRPAGASTWGVFVLARKAAR